MIILYIFLVLVYFAVGAFLIGIFEDGEWAYVNILYTVWFIFWPICLVMRPLKGLYKLLYKAGLWLAKKTLSIKRRKK